MPPCLELARTVRVAAVRPERHARGKCYVVADRQRTLLLVCQKLGAAVDVINAGFESDLDWVNAASLYEAAQKRLRHGFHMRRWRVEASTRDEAPAVIALERSRGPYAREVIVGSPAHYVLERVDPPGEQRGAPSEEAGPPPAPPSAAPPAAPPPRVAAPHMENARKRATALAPAHAFGFVGWGRG